ncbi:MAG: SDR family oxidoreductase [Clostridia bacterium]|nr:SDR family oxidoreductase [Clostridia bacterium]
MKKTVIVTGGSRGIGAETVRLFARRGYAVVFSYRNAADRAAELSDTLIAEGCDVTAVRADVSDPEQVRALFRRVAETYGSVDILINNAGIARQQLLTDVTDDDYRETVDTDLGGVIYCCREAVPYFLRHHEGVIVNVSSVWGLCGASCESVYSAAKAGVIGFTKALAKELGPSGIRVNCVAPGVIDTNMNACHSDETVRSLAEETPLLRIGRPEEVAETIFFLASEQASFITGQTIAVDGGFAL